MRMLVTVEFADAGTKSGSHRILTIGRGLEEMQSGNIGLSLEEAKSLVSAVQDEFVAAQAAIAIRYALSRWKALTRFVADGIVEIDNNGAERALRAVTK